MSLVNALWRDLGVALGLAALSGCASGPPLLCPKQGGPEWTRIESRNLVVFSDLPIDAARELTSELEQSLHALEQAAFTRTKPRPARTNVVAFRHEPSYRAVMPGRSVGAFARRLPGDLEASPTLLLWGELSEGARRIFLHELTHELFARNFGPSPVWMSEGWAEYYSTLEVENGRILLGTPVQPKLLSTEPRSRWVTLEDKSRVVVMPIDRVKLPSDLFELSYGTFYRGADTPEPTQGEEVDEEDQAQKQLDSAYLGAWALMHMLHDGVGSYSQRFARFALHAQQASVRDAWAKTFGDVNLATLDHDLKVYLLKGQFARHALRYQPPSTGFSVNEQQLSAAEVHTLWARLLPEEQAAKARAELAEALKEEPTLAEAYYHRGLRALEEEQQHDAAARDFTAAANLAPNDPRILFAQLYLALQQYRSGAEQALAKLSEQAPLVERLLRLANSPMQFRGLADYFKALGRSEQALDAARKAINLDPIDSWSLDTYARILSDQDRHDEALRVQRHAVDFLPEDSVSPAMLDFLRRLQSR